MKTYIRTLVSTFSAVAIMFTALTTPAQAADRTFEFDCEVLMADPGNWQPEITANPGDNLTINFTNCAGVTGYGGTSGGYHLTATSGTGGFALTDTSSDADTPAYTFEINETGIGSLVGRVVTNLNETYNLDQPTEEGSFLFVIENGGGTYIPIVKFVGESSGLSAGDVLGTVKFGPDSSVLTAKAKKELRAIATEAIDAGANTLKAKGFTAIGVDNSWSETKRISLATKRATAVKNFLLSVFEKQEADISVTVKAAGSKNPVKPNSNEKNRAKNRRVEVSFVD